MFEISDEKYAVANAIPVLKEMASRVLESNENNGVANYLEQFL
jgi:hydroxymethylpyrimidine pyrophosphatase-like HAD family hydrolase